MTTQSLFGPKPPACPLAHATCGDCNTYPCLMPEGPARQASAIPDAEFDALAERVIEGNRPLLRRLAQEGGEK